MKWDEIEQELHPSDFTMLTIPRRLEQKGDLFSEKKSEDIDHILDFLRKHTR